MLAEIKRKEELKRVNQKLVSPNKNILAKADKMI